VVNGHGYTFDRPEYYKYQLLQAAGVWRFVCKHVMKTAAVDGRLLACFLVIRNLVCQRFFALVIIQELIFEVLLSRCTLYYRKI